MKIRAKSNRNIVDVDDRRAESLVRAGIFEYVDSEETRTRRIRRAELVVEHAEEAAAVAAHAEARAETEADLQSKSKEELEGLAAGITVRGTGKDGYVTKADLLRALTRAYRRRDMRAEG